MYLFCAVYKNIKNNKKYYYNFSLHEELYSNEEEIFIAAMKYVI